jgi:geranylgeranyl pyrophosphate synthase
MLAGGDVDRLPRDLPLVVEVLHAGSLIVDDVQDDSLHRRGAPALHREIGVPLAVNTGNMLYCWALDLLATLALPPAIELELHRRMAAAMLLCHQGQALDLSVCAFTAAKSALPAIVRATTELKAGCLVRLAAELGAIAAGGQGRRVTVLARFGAQLGIGLQMLDDLGSLLSERRVAKALEDLRLGRPTWIWGWLADDLQAGEFSRLQKRAAAAARAGRPEQSLPELRELSAERGSERIRAHLAAALDSLRAALGPSAPLLALQQEIGRLEQSYG